MKEESNAAKHDVLRKELEAGKLAATDPVNADLPELALRTTTVYSEWIMRTCPVCKDRFREKDLVRLCPLCGQAYHDDPQYGLFCWQTRFADNGVCKKDRYDPILQTHAKGCPFQLTTSVPDDETRHKNKASFRSPLLFHQFLAGMETQWKPFGEAAVHQVAKGDPAIGHECPWCRYTIRAGDRVVKCPCGNCQTYFHDDLFRHLTCWNNWNGWKGNDFCPTTGARIQRTRPGD